MGDIVKFHLNLFKSSLNNAFSGKEPWQIVTLTTSSVLFAVWLYDFLNQDETITERFKKAAFKLAKRIPTIQQKIDEELKTIAADFEAEMSKQAAHLSYITNLPPSGLSTDNILKKINENLALGAYRWKEGCASGAVYCYDPDLMSLVAQIYKLTSYTNPLHPDLFPGLCKMEAEVVRIACNLFHGDDNSCGTMTTGGTESIIMACKAHRDYAKNNRGVKRPQIVVPVTVHSGFDKAAQYLGLRVKYIRVDPQTYQVDIKAMKRAINRNTIMLVGSAPNFPYGTMDDIAAISELGIKYGIPVHVDSCLGGFLTCFMEEAGYPTPPCDFRLPGVTSISADPHKYGFTPKGTSVVLYRDKKYLHHQYTVTTDWVGGVYGSPTVNGSRAGGNIAVCWATLLNFGTEGYIKATRDIVHTARYIEKGLRRLKPIFVFGQPATSVVAIGSNEFDIYRLSDALQKLGWCLNILQFPSGIHICVTLMHTKPGVADKFLNDVKSSLTEIMKDPGVPVEGKMALYGTAQKLPDRSIVSEITKCYLDSMYFIPKNKQ
ncbi:sphingosine-1-phosphate lyase [Cylas formicarius]|uniref:sphingosine-1-phosphate lyase n=1 Tax=Cylas formicarius TaxID=197179 RepID=UPI00295885B3|nr:sphingosine-1-phosphate lyase [Cylas formicarius]